MARLWNESAADERARLAAELEEDGDVTLADETEEEGPPPEGPDRQALVEKVRQTLLLLAEETDPEVDNQLAWFANEAETVLENVRNPS